MAGAPFWNSGVKRETRLPGGSNGQPGITINAKYSDHPWDTAWIAGKQLPGLCEVLDGLTQIGIDNKSPDGKDGSTLTVKGYRPGPFEISCTTWTEEQDGRLQEIEDEVWRKPNKGAKVDSVAVSVSHPALDRRGISSGALIGITFPKAGPFDGARTVHFKFIENVPPGKEKRVKSNDTLPGVVDHLQQDSDQPQNGRPLPPSKDRKALGPKGPPRRPSNGTD